MDRNSFLQGIAVGRGLRGVAASTSRARELIMIDPVAYWWKISLGNLARANDRLIQQGANNDLVYSENGGTWRNAAGGSAWGEAKRMVWGAPGYFYAAGDGYSWSPNLSTWTNGQFSTLSANAAVCCGNDYLAVGLAGGGSRVRISGGTPVEQSGVFSGLPAHDWMDVCIGDGKICVVGRDADPDYNTGHTLTKGITQADTEWVQGSIDAAKLTRVCWGKDRFMALAVGGSFMAPLDDPGIGGNSGMVTSRDGVNWSKLRMPINSTSTKLKEIIYEHNTWLIAGDDGSKIYLFFSYDGATWGRVEPPFTGEVVGFAVAENNIVIAYKDEYSDYSTKCMKFRTVLV